MERKKKREKLTANGNITNGTSTQSGDAPLWQKEPSGKRLASTSLSDCPQQPFHLMFNRSFPQYPIVQQQLGQPQLHGQATPTMQGQSQGGLQTLRPVSQPGWQNPEACGQSTGPAPPPIQPGTGESGWPPATGAPGMGPRPPPPFLLPPPPSYPGPWDPVSWWGHNPYPPPFAYMYPGYGNVYSCPMPPVPPIQRGVIKPPPGLSQKHHQMWEAQSMENTQLWTTTTHLWAALARADTEIALQRTKIVKLEGDLQQLVKRHQDSNVPQESGPARQSGVKRGRRKKDASVPVTSASSPASDPNTSRVSGVNTRASTGNMDSARQAKEMEREENGKSLGHPSELVYRPTMDEQDEKSCSVPTGSLRNEGIAQRHPVRQTLGFQSPTNSSINSSLTVAKDDLVCSHLNHISGPYNHISGVYKPSSLLAGRKDSSFDQCFRETTGASFFKNAGNGLDHHQVMMNGDVSFGALLNSGGASMGADTNGNVMARDAMVRSQLQAHLNAQAHLLGARHANPSWHCRGEDGSDEQDENGVSVQVEDGDDGDDEDDVTALASIDNEKVVNMWHFPYR